MPSPAHSSADGLPADEAETRERILDHLMLLGLPVEWCLRALQEPEVKKMSVRFRLRHTPRDCPHAHPPDRRSAVGLFTATAAPRRVCFVCSPVFLPFRGRTCGRAKVVVRPLPSPGSFNKPRQWTVIARCSAARPRPSAFTARCQPGAPHPFTSRALCAYRGRVK
jgi:hypothetical protein